MDKTVELLLATTLNNPPEKEYKIKRLSKESGGDIIFRLRALAFSHVAEVRAADSSEQSIRIILAGTVSPDLKSAELLSHYGAMTPADLLKKMLLPGEIDDLALRIERLSGYKATVVEEIKKK